jgi:hypothetical protein
VPSAGRLKYAHAFGHDLAANAIAGNHRDTALAHNCLRLAAIIRSPSAQAFARPREAEKGRAAIETLRGHRLSAMIQLDHALRIVSAKFFTI